MYIIGKNPNTFNYSLMASSHGMVTKSEISLLYLICV